MQIIARRPCVFAMPMVVLMVVFPKVGRLNAQDLADLKVDSTARKYDDKNPVQAAKQEFSLSKAGLLTLLYITDPYHKDIKGGYIPLEEVNGRSFELGRGIYQKRTPDSGIPGQRYTFEHHTLCATREKPLDLRATLVAPHRWASIQDSRRGEQLAANQVFKVSFTPFDKISSQPGPAPQVDVAGKWLHGDQNATLTFTPTGTAGEYEVVEKGYDNIKGTAKVKGNKIFIDWITTTAKDGKQKKGVTVVEIKPDGTHAEGWSVGEAGTGGETWTALPGTRAKPIGSTPGTTPTGGKPTPGTETVEPTEPAKVSGFTIQAGQRRGKPGEIVTVPVYLLNPGGVANLNITVGYVPTVALTEGKIARGNVLSNALFETNTGESGTARIGLAGTKPITESGILAHISFKITGKPGDRAELKVVVSTANAADGKSLSAETISGSILVLDDSGTLPGDSDGDNVLTAGDALAALKMSVRLIPDKKSCDVDRDGSVTSNDARLILQKVVGK